jgi:hypothetical protein
MTSSTIFPFFAKKALFSSFGGSGQNFGQFLGESTPLFGEFLPFFPLQGAAHMHSIFTRRKIGTQNLTSDTFDFTKVTTMTLALSEIFRNLSEVFFF